MINEKNKYRIQAIEAEEKGDQKKAEKYWNLYLKENQRDPFGWHSLSETLLKLGKSREALAASHKAVSYAKTKSYKALSLYSVGNIHEINGRKVQAENYYKKSVEYSFGTKSYVVLRMNLGIYLFKNGNKEESKNFFVKTIKCDPLYDEAHYYLGLYYYKELKFKLAERKFKKAIEIDKKCSYYLEQYGWLLYTTKRYKDARKYTLRALKLDPSNIGITILLAKILWDLRKLKDAERAYKNAIDLDPADSRGYWNYGEFLTYESRDPKYTELLFIKAIKIEPNGRFANNEYGMFLYYEGRNSEALKYLKKALRLGVRSKVTKKIVAELEEPKSNKTT